MTDRKAAVRAYKGTPRPTGVYRIRNTVNGDALIGSSVDLPSILNRHRFGLEFGNHRDRALQAAWNELGPDSFAFEVLDTLDPRAGDPSHEHSADLRELESLWRDRLGVAEGAGYGNTLEDAAG